VRQDDWQKLIEMIQGLGLKVTGIDKKKFELTVWVPPPQR
jgi:hypothetical protein